MLFHSHVQKLYIRSLYLKAASKDFSLGRKLSYSMYEVDWQRAVLIRWFNSYENNVIGGILYCYNLTPIIIHKTINVILLHTKKKTYAVKQEYTANGISLNNYINIVSAINKWWLLFFFNLFFFWTVHVFFFGL